ncbi:MAG: protein kinase [Sandaracinaceae bacterium]
MSQLSAGTVIDRKYRVARFLGAGAMGTVYEVQHELTGRRLALKVMNPDVGKDPDASKRFLREVRLASELRHPNVVEVVDAGHDPDADILYMAMELLDGSDLAHRQSDPRTTKKQALTWLLSVLEALSLAHSRGIIHRDMKPENVFLARQEDGTEVVKLVDFGIARSLGGKGVTQTGTTMGTPLFMSPEQALQPELVDHRTDLWAIGVMMYEIVAGVPPFDDPSPVALLLRAAAEPHVPLSTRSPGIDPRLSALVDRCLEKPLPKRIGSAAEVRAALAEILSDPAVDAHLVGTTVRATSKMDAASESDAFKLAQTALSSLPPTAPTSSQPVAATLPSAGAPSRRSRVGLFVVLGGGAIASLAVAALVAVGAATGTDADAASETTAGAPPAVTPEPVGEITPAAAGPSDPEPAATVVAETDEAPSEPSLAATAETEEEPEAGADEAEAVIAAGSPSASRRRRGRSASSAGASEEPAASATPAPQTATAQTAQTATAQTATAPAATPTQTATAPATERPPRAAAPSQTPSHSEPATTSSRRTSRRTSRSTPPPFSF